MTKIEEIIKIVKIYNPQADLDLINKAYLFAETAHKGQLRLSGEPVINHPLAVAKSLAIEKLGSVCIAAGFLHDVVEDTPVTLEDLSKEFGREVADLVNGVTKIGNIKLTGSSDEEFVENLRKMLLAMAKDLRVILIKLTDRLHNMQTLQYLPEKKQKRIARETLEVYAPLAERLGVGRIKGELEDLAFPFIFPKECSLLREYARPYYEKAEEYLKRTSKKIEKELLKEEVKAKVFSRPKHYYSLWKKLQRPGIDNDIVKIYDLVALRILVDNIKDCYASLGVVHRLFKPVPAKGVSDFIAQPKPNGYRSLHTTVFGSGGKITEIQIRTFEMHEQAEHGIAAHWYYSMRKNTEGISYKKIAEGFFAPKDKLSWVKQLVAWQKQVADSREFMEALKFDALAHRIFVFSPKGDVFDLPEGATPIDFAYAVHTKLGNEADGAKVNGKMASLNYKLKSGDMVEIIKKEGSKASEKWLRFVTTQTAKREISKHLSHKNG